MWSYFLKNQQSPHHVKLFMTNSKKNVVLFFHPFPRYSPKAAISKICVGLFWVLHQIELFISWCGGKFILRGIRIYQKTISPDHGVFKNPRCRFFPSCSEYTLQSLRQYGLLKGGMFSLLRIAKCHPFHRGGYDPVVKIRHCSVW